jgi:hypothetical protein
MGGMAFCCIGEGVVYPFLLMAFNKASDNPNELNDINGVYEVNTNLSTSLIWREGRVNFFDLLLITGFCLWDCKSARLSFIILKVGYL